MRTIKFRAWDGLVMIYSKAADQFTKSSDATNIGYVVNNYKTLMQFTGRKDKNGKEIYEGDICDGKYPAVESDTYRNVVKWDSDGYGFEFANAPLWAWDIEVIGNIYENPELLP